MLTHKGYVGKIEVDDEAELLHGRVINTRDVITFQGDSVPEAKQAFIDSVEEYLKFCEEEGKEPDKPFSGNFMTRLSPELHRAASSMATAENMSLNAWMEALVARQVEGRTSDASQPPRKVAKAVKSKAQPAREASARPRSTKKAVKPKGAKPQNG